MHCYSYKRNNNFDLVCLYDINGHKIFLAKTQPNIIRNKKKRKEKPRCCETAKRIV